MSWKSIKLLFGHLATDTRDAPRDKNKQQTAGDAQEEEEVENHDVAQDAQGEGVEEVENHDVSGYQAQRPTLSLSTIQGYKSALKAYYSDQDLAFSARGLKDSQGGLTLNERLNTVIEGYARVVTEKKAAGIMRMKEGRNSLTVQGYMDICKQVINLAKEGGPSATSVYLRASWSLGTTQDRYITGGEGNDNFSRRILAGNNLKKESFDVLTPHFTKAALTKLHQTGYHRFIDGYDTFPDGFKRCIPVFLANILYHLDTLKRWFPARHCLWGAPLFVAFGSDTMQQLQDLKKEVILCHGHCEDCRMSCAGVPPDIENISQIRSLKESITGLQQTNKENNDSLKELLSELRLSLPQELCQAMLERIEVNSANPVTRQDIEALKLEFSKLLDEKLAGLVRRNTDVNGTGEGTASSDLVGDNDGQIIGEGVRGQVFTWDGRLHPVPREFEFPQKIDCKNMWQRWHLGQINITKEGTTQNIGPLKVLDTKDLIKRNMRKNLSKARLVMGEVEKIARALQLLKDGESVNHSNYSLIFDAAYKEVIRQRYGETAWQRKNKRYNELAYTTLYKKLCRKGTGRRVRACRRDLSGLQRSPDEHGESDSRRDMDTSP
eukprot:3684-Hanusia_phi.AAC.5